MTATTGTGQLPRATRRETLATLLEVVLPVVARGPVVRRPRVLGLAERLDLDTRAVRRLQALRAAHGPGPVLLSIPGRDMAVVLTPTDVARVLNDTPEPFATDTVEKRAALERFQPHGALISRGPARDVRRELNERVLDHDQAMHRQAASLVPPMVEEMRLLARDIHAAGRLRWDGYAQAFHRTVRRIVLGEGARDDETLTAMLTRLRSSANWSVLGRRHARLQQEFHRRLAAHLERAEPGSLAGVLADAPAAPGSDPEQQVPQWLFAFDATAWASYRALALLHARPAKLDRAHDEAAALDLTVPQWLPYLRACMLESLRLYPTTPAILRDTTARTTWANGTMPEGCGVLVFAPFFHRDEVHVPDAHGFLPARWLDDGPDEWFQHLTHDRWPLVPFSAGPAVCPGRHLVLLTASTVLGALLQQTRLRLEKPQLPGSEPLPSVLSPFGISFSA